MIYIQVRWVHDLYDEPVMLYSELDSSRMEVRKVEVFADGHCGYASTTERHGSTRLGEDAIPDLDEIGQDPQFEPVAISAEAFEEIWKTRNDSS